MNKNYKQKLKELFSKEGFYIALFLCLCVIVTAGTFSYKKFIAQKQLNQSEDINQDVSYNSEENNEEAMKSEIPNAERVENDKSVTEEKKEEPKTENKSNAEKSTVVSTTNTVNFVNPLEGIESRTYTYPVPVKVGENVFRTIKGVNIESKVGTEVKAAAEGVVDLVENSGVEEGMVVEIKHPNGLKTKYANLDPNVSVKQGDKVKQNQVIGIVGSTAKVFSADLFGEFLNLQVINANNEQVNPEKYFNLTAK